MVSGVDLGGSLGADEGCCLASSIHFITGSDGVGLPFFSTARGSCRLVGVEEKTLSGLWKYNRANVAPFHYQAGVMLITSEISERALIGKKFLSHFGDRGKF